MRPLTFVALAFFVALQEKRTPLPEVGTYADRIEVRRDIAFGAEPHQKLDLYLPQGGGPFPVAVCWFGGGFTGGDKGGMAKVGAFLASSGIAAVAPGYFLADKAGERPGWPRNVHDAKSAVRFVRSKSKEWHLDPERVVALGHSSGAYLALMVAFTPHLKELEGEGAAREEPSGVRAVVEISGVCDRRRSLGTGTLALLGKGYEGKDDLRALASPVIYVGARTVPVYILHGEQDRTVDLSSARQLDEALAAAKVDHRLQVVPGGGHDPISVESMGPVVDWMKEQFVLR